MKYTRRLRWTASTGLFGAAALISASPVLAQGDVSARYARWELSLRDRVNDLLIYPDGAKGAAGDVLVGFRVGHDGKPTNIVIRRASGQEIFDRAALRLVSNLGEIGPVPSADGKIDEVVLKLSYGDPTSTVGDSMRLARKEREEQLANEHRDRALVSPLTQLAAKR